MPLLCATMGSLPCHRLIVTSLPRAANSEMQTKTVLFTDLYKGRLIAITHQPKKWMKHPTLLTFILAWIMILGRMSSTQDGPHPCSHSTHQTNRDSAIINKCFSKTPWRFSVFNPAKGKSMKEFLTGGFYRPGLELCMSLLFMVCWQELSHLATPNCKEC